MTKKYEWYEVRLWPGELAPPSQLAAPNSLARSARLEMRKIIMTITLNSCPIMDLLISNHDDVFDHHHMLNEHCSLYAHLIIIIISSYYHHHHNKLISSSSLDDLQEHQLASCWLSGPTQTRFGQSAGSSPRGQFVWKVVESWSNLVRHPIQVGKLGKCSHL